MRNGIAVALLTAALLPAGSAAQTGASPTDDRLLEAARDGAAEVVRALVAGGAGVNSARGDGMTALHFAAERGHLPHQGGGEEGVVNFGRQEDRLDLVPQFAVHLRHLELVVEVRYGPQSPDDESGPDVAGEVDEEPRKGDALHPRLAAEHLLEDLQPLRDREQASLRLRGRPGDRHDQAVGEAERPPDHILVAEGDRVERAGVDGDDGTVRLHGKSPVCKGNQLLRDAGTVAALRRRSWSRAAPCGSATAVRTVSPYLRCHKEMSEESTSVTWCSIQSSRAKGRLANRETRSDA